MNKKMITIAEIAFALIFVILMAGIFNTVTGFGNNANSTMEAINQAVSDADLIKYNNTTVSGDTVISTINKFKETKGQLKLSYCVDSTQYGYGALKKSSGNKVVGSDGETISGYSASTATSSYTSYNTALKPGNTGFISPVQNYNAQLAFNENGVIIGVIFTK